MALSKAWLTLTIAFLSVATPASSQGASATKLLSSVEIRGNIAGKLISYSPPGTADAGAHEEFHKDGRWRGTRYSRGPIDFSGRWSIEDNQLCVVADKGSWAEKQHPGKYCRQVWKKMSTGQMLIAHIAGPGGLQVLSVRDLITGK